MTRTQGRILVIRGGAIGDFMVTLPAIAALRHQFPNTHLELLGYPHIASLALAGGLVDAVRSIDARPLAGFFASRGELAEEWKAYFASFHMVVSYLYDPDEIFQSNVQRCSRAQFIAGPYRPDETLGRHATEVFLKPLERVAIFDADTQPKLRLISQGAAASKMNADNQQPPLLAIHPGSGSELKNWPERKWSELLEALVASTNWRFLLIGGEAEGERLERLEKLIPTSRQRIARNLPLVDLAGRLVHCDAFVGHDSGITHLAAALNLPVCVLWGETVEAVWRPQGERVTFLRHSNGLSALSVPQVGDALRSLV